MAIKEQSLLTRMEFNEALIKLRLSISEVSKETKIPRTYMSEFRNGDRQLRPEMLSKLRDFFESKGLEFEEESNQPLTIPKIENFSAKRITIPVADEMPVEVMAKSLSMISENEARIATLLDLQADHDDEFFGEDEFSDSAKENLQEIYGLLALNSIIYLSLRGWSALNIPPGIEGIPSLRDIVFESFKPQLVAAGLLSAPEEETE